ncbi:YjfI family protein [Rhizobium panacihumi]|uniref:YjfI family protein n=1 Tax=Rhizobium panacihumi TaxID=2008450 RepID=UPI003D78E7B9
METWTLTTLTRLFAADPEALGDVDVSVPAHGDVLCVTLKEKGDLDVFVALSGERDILASVILTPCKDVPNREAFERMVLKTHKFVPLSSFGITTVNGEEWYELFGSLSARSRAEIIVEEVAVLAANAVDAADMIAEWKNGEFDA